MAFFGFFSSPIVQVILIIVYSLSFGTYSFFYFHGKHLSNKATVREISFSVKNKEFSKSDYQFQNSALNKIHRTVNSHIVPGVMSWNIPDEKIYIILHSIRVNLLNSEFLYFSKPPPLFNS